MYRTIEAYERLAPKDLSGKLAPASSGCCPSSPRGRITTTCRSSRATSRRSRGSSSTAPASAATSLRVRAAFGSDAEDRDELPGIARSRAALPAWPRERTVVIGDTPRDIACARADGVRVVAVGTGPFGIEALADADAVVDDARALLPVLENWATSPD